MNPMADQAPSERAPMERERVKESPLRLAIVFHRFGPYHKTRIEATCNIFDVTGVELSASTTAYDWERVSLGGECQHVTVCRDTDSRGLSIEELIERVDPVLRSHSPDVVAINGWADNGALATLLWCQRNEIPTIVMSESNQMDFQRHPAREFIKKQLIRNFSAALVGGTLARDYLIELGMSSKNVFLGYDVIDNEHFVQPENLNSAEVRSSLGFDRPYFLASNRFIDKKNLPRLIDAYGAYHNRASKKETSDSSWDLVLLGDGSQRDQLVSQAQQRGLAKHIHFLGFRQYDELPRYYWGASAFVHASTTEQWGLVVNEAMAAGLPVIVSRRCGSAADLVRHEETGFVFDPTDTGALAGYMWRLASDPDRCQVMSMAGKELIDEWGPSRFVEGITDAVEAALSSGARSNLSSRIVLRLMCR